MLWSRPVLLFLIPLSSLPSMPFIALSCSYIITFLLTLPMTVLYSLLGPISWDDVLLVLYQCYLSPFCFIIFCILLIARTCMTQDIGLWLGSTWARCSSLHKAWKCSLSQSGLIFSLIFLSSPIHFPYVIAFSFCLINACKLLITSVTEAYILPYFSVFYTNLFGEGLVFESLSLDMIRWLVMCCHHMHS